MLIQGAFPGETFQRYDFYVTYTFDRLRIAKVKPSRKVPLISALAAGRTADRRGHQQGRGAGCAHAALPALVELSGVVRCHRRGELCDGGGHP